MSGQIAPEARVHKTILNRFTLTAQQVHWAGCTATGCCAAAASRFLAEHGWLASVTFGGRRVDVWLFHEDARLNFGAERWCGAVAVRTRASGGRAGGEVASAAPGGPAGGARLGAA